MTHSPEYIRGWDQCAAEILLILQGIDSPDLKKFYHPILNRLYGTRGTVLTDSDLVEEEQWINEVFVCPPHNLT